MPVRIRVEHGPHEGTRRGEVLRRAEVMFASLQLGKAELSIVLTDEKQIQKLNREYRQMDRPTDVLAFAMREGRFKRFAGDLLGDVIISVPRARVQARQRNVVLLDEITKLVAHGILHLLGWDHDTKAKDKRMRAATEHLCRLAAKAPVRVRRVPQRKENRHAQSGFAKVAQVKRRRP